MIFTGVLNNWTVIGSYGVYKVAGQIVTDGSGRFTAGQEVVTSPIEVLNVKEGWVKTKNSTYKLIG